MRNKKEVLGKNNLEYKLIFVLTFLLSMSPSIVGFYQEGLSYIFSAFSADTFYYLNIANNSTLSFYSFDGNYPTNGFHPLWQYFLTVSFAFLKSKDTQIIFVFIVSNFLVAFGISIIAYSIHKKIRHFSLSLLCLIPGMFFVFFMLPVNNNYGAVWSFINGMESPLSIFLFGILFFLATKKENILDISNKELVLVSIVLTLITLSRLDDIFLFVPFYLLIASMKENILKRAVIASVVPTVTIGMYLLFNYLYAGSLVPSSGTAKSGFALLGNGYNLLRIFFPFKTEWEPEWGAATWRSLQLVVPLLFSIVWLYKERNRIRNYVFYKKIENHLHLVISFLCVFVFLKSSYNFLFVPLWHQGHWYFSINLIVTNIIIAVLFLKIPNNRNTINLKRMVSPSVLMNYQLANKLTLVAVVLFSLYISSSFVNNKKIHDYNQNYFVFFQNASNIKASLTAHGVDKILSFDDGIVAYSLGFQTLNGLGLAGDKKLNSSKKKGDLLSLAYSRGYNIFTSLNYPISMLKNEMITTNGIRNLMSKAFYFRGKEKNLDKWEYELIYFDENLSMPFIRFIPRQRDR